PTSACAGGGRDDGADGGVGDGARPRRERLLPMVDRLRVPGPSSLPASPRKPRAREGDRAGPGDALGNAPLRPQRAADRARGAAREVSREPELPRYELAAADREPRPTLPRLLHAVPVLPRELRRRRGGGARAVRALALALVVACCAGCLGGA